MSTVARALQYLDDFNRQLDEAEKAPDGDDFNRLCVGLTDILHDKPAPVQEIKEKKLYTVLMQQYVEHTASAGIDAYSPEEAKDIALSRAHEYEWREGDDCWAAEAYSVMDEDGNIVWERG